MDRLSLKRHRLERRVTRVRHAIVPGTERKRLLLHKTNKHLVAQIVDDKTGNTVCQASTLEKSFAAEVKGGKKNREAAKRLGAILAKRATEKGIKKVYFDRRGRLYHGKIADFADQAREAGLEF